MPTNEKGPSASFNYSSQPHPVKAKGSKKYRDKDADALLNMMSDPRVVRGNTHALTKKVSASRSAEFSSTKETLRNQTPIEDSYYQPTYSFQIQPFASDDTDLDRYLNDPDDDVKPKMAEKSSQSDAFQPRPATPPYIPRKTGIDRSTQVEDVRELFIFDLQVEPILDVIVSKTLEQALWEVSSEDNLETIESVCKRYVEDSEKEALWRKTQELATIEEFNNRAKILDESTERQRSMIKARTLVAGCQLMKQILPSILDEMSSQLLDEQTWKDPDIEVARYLLSSTIQGASTKTDALLAAQNTLDEILYSSCQVFEDSPSFQPCLPSEVTLTIEVSTEESGVIQLGPWLLSCDDTILSTNLKITDEAKAKNVPTEKMLSLNLKSFLERTISRKIAVDAPILNFDFPKALRIII